LKFYLVEVLQFLADHRLIGKIPNLMTKKIKNKRVFLMI